MKKMAMTFMAMVVLLSSAQATNYTAVLSGNFSSSTTWSGGVTPTLLVSGDQVIIPAGMTVTMDNDVSFALGTTLDVDGTITSGTNMTTLVLGLGSSVVGTGSIIVDSMSVAVVSGMNYTGTIVAENMTSLTSTFSSAADVTVNNTLYVTLGILSVTDGSITMGSGSTIVIDGGSLSFSGNGSIDLSGDYNVMYEGASTNSGLELSGSGLQNVEINVTGALTLTTDLMIDGMLTLTSGNLILNNNDLTFGTGSDLFINTGSYINSTSGSSITINSTNGFTGDLVFGAGNNSVNNFTLNLGTSANVDLGSDIDVNGTLTLTSGTLTLNNNDLSFAGNGDFAVSGTGSIVSTSGSDISIASNNNFSGAIRFKTTGNTVGDLMINLGSNTNHANIGSDLHIAGTLTLNAGMLNVGTNNLMINTGGSVIGGSSNSYVVTSNGGRLTMNLATSGSQTFHVGTMMHYSPAMIAANTGSVSSDISVMADDSVYSGGTFGYNLANYNSVVNNTWYITSSSTTGLDLDIQLMWSAAMEMNGFDRTQAYISHYTNGSWDLATTGSATTSGSLYVINRNNITSLSPFTVADANAALAVGEVAASNNDVTVYPNPATDVVNFTSSQNVTSVSIYDVSGRMVKTVTPTNNSISVSDLTPGYYNLHLNGKDTHAVQNFIKK